MIHSVRENTNEDNKFKINSVLNSDFNFFLSTFCLKLGRTLLSSFVMARESIGSDRLRSERYPSSLFSSSGSGALSASSCGGTGADGAGLSLLTVEPSVLPPPSDHERDNRNKNLFQWKSHL